MQVTEDGAASKTTQLAHERPAVERWLSWSGLVPLPAFLLLHLSRELWLAFASDVSQVLRPAPSLLGQVSSWLLVWLPLGVHVALGVYLAARGQRLSALRVDVPPLARLVSRVTSVIALLFVVYHAKSYALPVWFGEASPQDSGFRLLAELSSTRFGVPVLGGAYLLGLLATVTHTALAVHRALLGQGLLESAARRSGSARACAAFGVVLFLLGASAVIRVASGLLLR
jgi:succinate dehydrogenase / fumarate reductase, cytochrome b subunit